MAIALLLASLFGSQSVGGDTDGDGLDDSEERAGWIIYVDLVGKRVVRQVTSDVHTPDTDGDGLDDAVELLNGLDARNPDTDGDGLSDCQEQLHTVRDECEDPDFTDYDGGYGTNPSNADSDRGPSRYVQEILGYVDESFMLNIAQVTWGDGISDSEELFGRTITLADGRVFNDVVTDPLLVDSDGDGLEDGEEVLLYGTHPAIADTDGDGCVDGLDPRPVETERYNAGIQTITFDSARNYYLHIVVGDRALRIPSEGTLAGAAGPNDVSGLMESVRPPGCPYSLNDPWSLVQVIVIDVDANRALDLSSQTKSPATNVGDALSVWLNAIDEELGITREGPYQEDAFKFTGSDGSIAMRPFIA